MLAKPENMRQANFIEDELNAVKATSTEGWPADKLAKHSKRISDLTTELSIAKWWDKHDQDCKRFIVEWPTLLRGASLESFKNTAAALAALNFKGEELAEQQAALDEAIAANRAKIEKAQVILADEADMLADVLSKRNAEIAVLEAKKAAGLLPLIYTWLAQLWAPEWVHSFDPTLSMTPGLFKSTPSTTTPSTTPATTPSTTPATTPSTTPATTTRNRPKLLESITQAVRIGQQAEELRQHYGLAKQEQLWVLSNGALEAETWSKLGAREFNLDNGFQLFARRLDGKYHYLLNLGVAGSSTEVIKRVLESAKLEYKASNGIHSTGFDVMNSTKPEWVSDQTSFISNIAF